MDVVVAVVVGVITIVWVGYMVAVVLSVLLL